MTTMTPVLREMILNRIIAARQWFTDKGEMITDIDMPLKVINVVTFDHPNEWGHDGTIDVQYSTKKYRARYGWTHLGTVSCYLD